VARGRMPTRPDTSGTSTPPNHVRWYPLAWSEACRSSAASANAPPAVITPATWASALNWPFHRDHHDDALSDGVQDLEHQRSIGRIRLRRKGLLVVAAPGVVAARVSRVPVPPDLVNDVARLDALLHPIAERPVDRSDPDWFTKLMTRMRTAPPPLVEAGIETEGRAALRALVDLYAEGDEETREAAREVFRQYTSFRWGAHIPLDPTSAGVRFQLLHLSAVDQGNDPRDQITSLQGVVEKARSAGVPVRALLVEVAELSSDVAPHRIGSMRQFLLRQVEQGVE
jgi:hypothetical protein